MIPKGNQRSGGQQLATHLLNAYDNDRVEVAEVRGAIAPDLHGAFAEWYAEAKATQCHKYLYSMSINPDHTQGPFNRDHYYDFIARTENKLGLAGQPRAVVFHVKHGREHCHVVWSRIDTEKMKAVQLSHDRQKLRAVAQEYARDYKLILPPGMSNDRGKDRFPDHAKTENLAEKQQEERTGISKKQRTEQITKAWRESSDARSLINALESGGYYLARGDKRSYVVVDIYGEIHSLSRYVSGVKAKDIKARLAGHPVDKLPTAAEAQDRAREQRQALLLEKQQQQGPGPELSRAERTAEAQAIARQRRDTLLKAQALRRATLDSRRQHLVERHNAERKGLSDLQNARNAQIARDRAAKQPTGVLSFLARITGFNAITAFRHARQDRQTEQAHRQQTAALARRHKREMENFKHQERGLTALDKRESRSLETAIRREAFRAIAAPAKTRAPAPELTPAQQAKLEKARQLAEEISSAASTRQRQSGQGAFELTPEQLAKIAEFKRAARDKSEQAGGRSSTAGTITKKPPAKLSPAFNEAAISPAPSSEGLAAKFNEKAEKKQTPSSGETPAAEGAKDRAQEIKENADGLTAAARRALDLAKEFNERAAHTRQRKDRDKHHHRPAPDPFRFPAW
jgi:hypothetical protein